MEQDAERGYCYARRESNLKFVLCARSFLTTHPLADTFHPPYPPIASQSISRNVPLAQARAFQFAKPLFRGVAEAALYCAHRTSTVSPCAFCEQEGHLAAPSPSF